jgi:hypothetical protein
MSFGSLARIGPPQFVDVPRGTLAIEPPESSRCWGIEQPKNGMKHCRCDRRSRRDRLTCHNHRRAEAAAQKLKSNLEAQEKSA